MRYGTKTKQNFHMNDIYVLITMGSMYKNYSNPSNYYLKSVKTLIIESKKSKQLCVVMLLFVPVIPLSNDTTDIENNNGAMTLYKARK